LSAALALIATPAWASNVTEFPDNGSEQLGRGGAWIARASDPLAAFYNPAGLAGQPTRLTLQANIVFGQTCFKRVAALNDTTQDPLKAADGTFPAVCNDGAPHFPPNPQLAFAWSPTPRLGLGFAFLAPSGIAKSTWPEFVKDPNDPMGTGQAAPQRYLLLSGDALFVTPTVGIGYEVIDNLRLGASFQWGIASAKFTNAVTSVNGDNASPRDNDLKAELAASDLFIPGGTIGALWSPSDWVDIAGWFKFSKGIEATGDLKLNKNYFSTANRDGKVVPGSIGYEITDTSKTVGDPLGACGTAPRNAQGAPTGSGLMTPEARDNCKPGAAHLYLPVPIELKIGVRVHQPRMKALHVRDPMQTDLWDAELDITYAQNSSFDYLRIRFPAAMPGSVDGVLPVAGIMGNPIPAVGDVAHRYRDVIGVRLGGDVNVLPDKLAVRAGGFFETQAGNSTFQTIDFMAGARVGLSLGGTYRIRLSKEKSSAIELHAGFMHMFVFDSNNFSQTGLNALSGTACNPAGGAGPGNLCSDGRAKYQSNWPVNLGTISNQVSAINLGASYRF
jgi:long-chain fatty acid transport protein